MNIVISAAFSVAAIVLAVMCGRKKTDGGRLCVLLCLAVLLSSAAAAGAAASASGGIEELLGGVAYMTDTAERRADGAGNALDTGKLLTVLLSLLAPLPGVTAALICFLFGIKGSGGELMSKAFAVSFFGTAAGIGALFYGLTVLVFGLGAAAVGMLQVLAAGAVITLMTLGLGLIIAIALIPIYAVILAFGTAASCLGFAAASCIWGAAFLMFCLCTGVMAAVTFIRQCRSGALTKKKAVLYSILCFIPAVNIFAAGHFKKAFAE